jgi:hypothetical protein
MTKRYFGIFSIAVLVALGCGLQLANKSIAKQTFSIQATPMLVDGVRESQYKLLATDAGNDLAVPGPGSWSGTAWTDLISLYVYQTQDALYIYVDLPAYQQQTSTGEIGLAIETSADQPNIGGSVDPWQRAITFGYTSIYHNWDQTPQNSLYTRKPDWMLRGNIPGFAATDNGWTELRHWTDGRWANANINWGGLLPNQQQSSRIAYANQRGVEIMLPYADLGILADSPLHLQFFALQAGATKGAFDTLPSDNQSTNWDTATTQTNLASLPFIAPVTPTASPTSTPIFTPTPLPNLPDLRVRQVLLSPATCSSPQQLQVEIENVGPLAVVGDFKVQINQQLLTVNGLASQGEITLNAFGDPLGVQVVLLDTDDQILEWDENNNAFIAMLQPSIVCVGGENTATPTAVRPAYRVFLPTLLR